MTDTRYAAYTIYRTTGDVELIESTRLTLGAPTGRREATDLTAAYLMALMAGAEGATVREVSQRPVMWLARFPDAPSRDEVVVLMTDSQEYSLDILDLWVQATADR